MAGMAYLYCPAQVHVRGCRLTPGPQGGAGGQGNASEPGPYKLQKLYLLVLCPLPWPGSPLVTQSWSSRQKTPLALTGRLGRGLVLLLCRVARGKDVAG